MTVTSPTSLIARGRVPGGLVSALRLSLVVALLFGLVAWIVPAASADGLKDQRDKVRKALVQAKQEITSDQKAVDDASSRLKNSQAQLAKARSELADVQRKLAAAKAEDAAIAADLAVAQKALAAAAAAVAKAQAAVADQEALIGVVVRAAYQQQSTLVGLTMIVGSETPGDLAQRVQWANTIFDSSTSQLDRLKVLRTGLEAAKAVRADAEAKVSAQRDRSAALVAQVRALNADATARAAKVARLVAANARLKAEAQDELDQTQAQYKALERQEARIAAKLRNAGYNVVNNGGFIKPVDAPNGSPFGMRFHPILHYWRMHWGTDFGAACGQPIRAMANGKVVSAGWTTYGFGNYTIISYGRVHGASVASGYAHQSKVIVHAGQKVKQGQVVGYVGTTGLSTGCHLHLQIYRNGVRVNPMRYL
ncbi:MAG TPA: peptidoglycan DD-metalloendopeptidase family protein [Propionicimonas sp.]|uniref:peptidoglycan DD-metalloendopeptidase family protein n=1 Tax=Propionicimonas sp. TaxID=1955623 RepID=UPI002F3E6823